jgi:histidine triad (HIT) family protein
MRFITLLFLSLLSLTAAETNPCVFCEIVAGTKPAAAVYRDDQVMAFLSIGPRNPGHVLVIPLAENFLAVPAGTMHAMTDAAKRIAQALPRAVKCEGFNLLMNTGKAADQTVFHAHLHIIPRYVGEPLAKHPNDIVSLPELEAVAARIRAELAK